MKARRRRIGCVVVALLLVSVAVAVALWPSSRIVVVINASSAPIASGELKVAGQTFEFRLAPHQLARFKYRLRESHYDITVRSPDGTARTASIGYTGTFLDANEGHGDFIVVTDEAIFQSLPFVPKTVEEILGASIP